MRRLHAERRRPLESWPPPELLEAVEAGPRREAVDRRGGSGVATVASVASSGAPVLALCADALRRRELVERAAAPARFGGGSVAIASGRLAEGAVGTGVEAVLEARAGVLLADWAALDREPSMSARFDHVVLVDPPPFAHLESVASAGAGYLHLAWGNPETELTLRVLAEEWPDRAAVEAAYRSLRSMAANRGEGDGELGCDLVQAALHGPGRHPRSPEVAARRLRVLEELGAVRWQPSATASRLRVVSSKGTLELLETFIAYRGRYEEGRRFLSGQRQPS